MYNKCIYIYIYIHIISLSLLCIYIYTHTYILVSRDAEVITGSKDNTCRIWKDGAILL